MMGEEDFSIKELLMENRSDTKIILNDMATVKEHLRTLNGRVGTSEKDIKNLQRYKWKTVGAVTMVSVIVPIIITLILKR
jgi:hypothetical protein